MKKSVLSLLISIPTILSSQNLVPNPGFDVISSCPVDGQIRYAPPWSNIANLVIASSQGSVNLYNACVPPPGLGVPISRFGVYQPARSGNGYALVHAYGGDNDYVRSYIQAPLLSPLVKDKIYFLRFYVNPGSIYAGQKYFYTDAIGLGFHPVRIDSLLPMYSPPPEVHVGVENRGVLLKDTMNWVPISGCYKATGDEEFIVIGNFNTDTETLFEDEEPQSLPNYARYFIEDLFVGCFDPLPDTILLCEGDTKILNAGFLDASYYWSTGEADSIITVVSPGEYIIEARLDNCILSDTVQVILITESQYFQSDTLICADEVLVLTSPVIGEYHWTDGSDNKIFLVQTNGRYEVTVTNECGQFIFSTNVETEECDCIFFIANIFSPNRDGINDNLQVSIQCDFIFKIEHFRVFDRWGSNVFSASDTEEINWNGLIENNTASSGVYSWIMEYTIIRNQVAQNFIKHGDVTLLR